MKVATIFMSLCALGLLPSCHSVSALFDGGPYEMERMTEEYKLVTEEAYTVGVGDLLEISILSEGPQGNPIAPEDFRRRVPVLPDGRISFLYNDVTGDVVAAGKTAGEIAKILQRQLVEKSRVYLGAQVAVIIIGSASSSFYVAGEVRTPGQFGLSLPTTVTQAIVRAGWFTEFADKKNIQIVRREGDREIRYTFNYADWERRPRRTKYHDMLLRPNDIVVVPD